MRLFSILQTPFLTAAACVLLVGLAALPAQARDCDRIYFGTELVDDVTYCASSVLPNSKVATYRPGNLAGWDDNAHRAWCEGDYDNGAGEWFEFSTRPNATIRTMVFLNGYQKSHKAFSQNARARDITIQTDRGLVLKRRLRDQMGRQVIKLDDWHDVGRIRVTINNVYNGTKYNDLCISGFTIDFEERREYEFRQMQ